MNIPNISKFPLHYVFEDLNLKHEEGTLWLEFGVASGKTINYISKFTDREVYGFDSFNGLPERWREGFEKGMFARHGNIPRVNSNVVLIQGLFQDTLSDFLREQNKKISFIHVDCDLYSASKYVLNTCKPYIEECVIVFDELVNYPGYEDGEWKAWNEFLQEHPDIEYEWIGMNGCIGMEGYEHENVAVHIKKI